MLGSALDWKDVLGRSSDWMEPVRSLDDRTEVIMKSVLLQLILKCCLTRNVNDKSNQE